MFNWIKQWEVGPADWRLIRAARAGDVARAQRASKSGASARAPAAQPALCAALCGAPNALAMCELLLSLGADPNQACVGPVQSAPLHLAPFCDNAPSVAPQIVKALLLAGADPNAKNQLGETPLTLMAGRERRYEQWALEVCSALIFAGADPHQKGANGESALERYQRGELEAQSSTYYLGMSLAGQLTRRLAREARVNFEIISESAAIAREMDARALPLVKQERGRL